MHDTQYNNTKHNSTYQNSDTIYPVMLSVTLLNAIFPSAMTLEGQSLNWCYSIHHIDTQYNDTQNNDTRHNVTYQNNDTIYPVMLSVTLLNAIFPSVMTLEGQALNWCYNIHHIDNQYNDTQNNDNQHSEP